MISRHKISYFAHRIAYHLNNNLWIGSILKRLAGKFSEYTRKKGKGAKTGTSHDWRGFYLSQYDWLKDSYMTKVVWLPNETDYLHCEFVATNTPYLPKPVRKTHSIRKQWSNPDIRWIWRHDITSLPMSRLIGLPAIDIVPNKMNYLS